jgi:mono/diheme cytochrome c family protein
MGLSLAAATSPPVPEPCDLEIALLPPGASVPAPAPPARPAPPAPPRERVRPLPSHTSTAATVAIGDAAADTALIKQYCVACHSDRAKAGGLTLAAYDAAAAPEHAEVSEKIIRKLRAGMMPPAGAKRPEPAALLALVTSLEARMDAAARATPDPGWRPFQRLNRVEYARAVRDLVGLDIDVAQFLPADTISQGFDNVADSQTFSATLMEGYLRAAGRIAALAVGDPDAVATETAYKVPRTASQLQRVDGAPMGTRGGTSVVHNFPADGEYIFGVELHANACGVLFGNTVDGEVIEVSIEGRRVALIEVDRRLTEATTGLSMRTPPVHVRAGPQRVTAAFLLRAESPVLDIISPIDHTLADTQIGVEFGITTVPHLRDFTVIGPRNVTGVSETESRRRIFTCRPTTAAEEPACAAEIVRGLATKAYRGAVTTADFEGLMAFYEDGRRQHDFEFGVMAALEAILASPQFLFRVESAPATVAAGDTYRLDERDLATRLSFFLWSTGPDEELLALAGRGRLGASLPAQVRRMLADPRSESLATRFASQWLRLQDVDQILPDALLYPHYDHTLGQAFKRESQLLFDSLVREDRSILELLTADYTFVNERIARHYGIPNVTGSAFQRVSLPEERRGILGHGSILTLTSVADRTSPVMRGKWVMEVLLGSPPPPPPPNVPELEASGAAHGGRLLSVRERLEEHRANPACTSCHRVIDPIGLALENYDVTGQWRIKDNGVDVDPVGELYDGTAMEGPAGLREALLKHRDAFLLSFTENLMIYALGRRVETADLPLARHLIREAAAEDYRVSAFVLALVESPAFRMSRVPEAATTVASRQQDR